MECDFDLLPDRHASECVKWHHYAEDVIPLWVADMDFPSPQPVIQALRARIDHGVFGYPEDDHGHSDLVAQLRQTLVERMADRYDWQIQPEDILFVPGVVTGFNLTCHALAAPDGGVLVQTPVYPPMLEAPGNAGLARQEMVLTCNPDGSYTIDMQAYAAAIDSRTRLFLLCNPHNPVGRVFRKDELEAMAEICLRKGVEICADEIHCDLIFKESRHVPIASLDPEVAQHTLTLIAPSKTYNIAGLQTSFAIIQNPDLRQAFRQAHKGLVHGVNLLGLVASLAAYRDGQEWLDELMVYLQANRDYLFEFVQASLPGVSMAKPEGTYLAWLDCRDAGLAQNPYKFFLEKAHVALSEGIKFGRGGEGFARLNFGCPRFLLEEALDRMKRALESR